MNSEPYLEAALEYIKRGWAVTPDHSIFSDGTCSCRDPKCKTQGKHPRIDRESPLAHLRREGVRNLDEVHKFWGKWPNSNVAICCGEKSNLVVIDIDPRNDGLTSLAKLTAKYGSWSDTLSAISGGKGMHLYFEHPKNGPLRNRIGLMPGIDVKADGGRIVAPPSKHTSGNIYSWKNKELPLLPLPTWLHTMIQHEKGTGTWRLMRKQNADKEGPRPERPQPRPQHEAHNPVRDNERDTQAQTEEIQSPQPEAVRDVRPWAVGGHFWQKDLA